MLYPPSMIISSRTFIVSNPTKIEPALDTVVGIVPAGIGDDLACVEHH